MERLKILIVDDDPVASSSVAQRLELEPLDVAQAQSPRDAIDLLEKNCYDLIVTSLISDSPDSLDLLEIARGRREETPIIVTGTVGDLGAAIDRLRPGVDDFLPKPFKTEELLFRVRGCIRRAKLLRLSDELARQTEDRACEVRQMHEMLAEEVKRHERAKDLLAGSLRDKELLLREIGHRIKNNLAMIVALVNLESKHPARRSRPAALAELLRRVRAIYLVYEKLSLGPGLVLNRFREYVEALVRDIFQNAGRSSEEILTKVEIADLALDVDRAIPVGLIIQELVSNSLAHGFPGRAKGWIRVRLECGEEEYRLTVSDTGIGFPKGFDPASGRGLGFTLVRTLTEQLDGRVETTAYPGAAVLVRFPLSDARL